MLRRKSIQKRIAKTILFRKDGTLNFNLYRKCFSFNYRDGISDLDLQKISQAITQKATRIESHFLVQMHTILTPEQRQKFAQNLEEWEVE